MSTVVLERQFDPPLCIDDLEAMRDEANWCLEQHRVDHLFSLLSPDGRDLICTFTAPDAEALRRVLRQLGETQAYRAWSATVHAPPSDPPMVPPDGGTAAVVLVERSFPAPFEIASCRRARTPEPGASNDTPYATCAPSSRSTGGACSASTPRRRRGRAPRAPPGGPAARPRLARASVA
ncbi:MAG: hypothetical protein U0802_20790 [Candidatus Binatia bacterium]